MESLNEAINSLMLTGEKNMYLIGALILMLLVIFFMYKTYRASVNVEAKLAEFSSLTSSVFANKMQLIEANAQEFRLNKQVLGPLARIIDAYTVLVTNREGLITYANEKFLSLSGYQLRELIGQPQSMHRASATAGDNELWQGMQETLKQDKVWHGELCSRAKDRTVYWMDALVFPLSYITDVEEGYIWFCTDITAIKAHNTQLLREVKKKDEAITKVESLLLHSEKMASLGTISAGIAHEINNPIAFITANVSRLKEYVVSLAETVSAIRERVPAEKLDRLLATRNLANLTVQQLDMVLQDYPSLVDETTDGIERIRKIIRDLKSFSHEKAEHFDPVDIHQCIETSLNLARHETRNKLAIKKNYAEHMPVVQGSESQISQVFVNLIVNAAQAIDGRGEVCITTEVAGDFYRIEMRDNGPGIEPKVLENIFEPFYTTKPVGEGTGLGLAISQDIIKRHGGRITAQSKPGEGTAFIIELPLAGKKSSHAA